MLAGARLHLEAPNLTVDGIYTFGLPRTCDRVLAAACNKGLAKRIHRFVNNNDIVPQLPPEPAFTHVDTLRYIDASGKVRESMTLLGGLADRAKGLTADPFAPALRRRARPRHRQVHRGVAEQPQLTCAAPVGPAGRQ